MMTTSPDPRRRTLSAYALLGLAAIVLTALVLRPAATVIGPVLAELQTDFHIGPTASGLLTGLPGFTFAVAGLLANRLSVRFGLTPMLLAATAAVAAGGLIRVLTGSWAVFLVFTLVALAGMAIGNVLLPAFVKRDFADSTTAVSTLYTTVLGLGTCIPLAIAVPVTDSLGHAWLGQDHGWRLIAGVWSVPAVLAAVCWLWVGVRHRRRHAVLDAGGQDAPAAASASSRAEVDLSAVPLIASPTAVALTVFFGLQSMNAYVQFGWVAQVYRDAGLEASAAGLMVAIIALGGVIGGLLMPAVVPRLRLLRWTIVAFGVLLIVGYAGLALAPTTLPWLWALALALSGMAFPTSLAMVIACSDQSRVTVRLSGFVQPIGYLLAAVGPLLVGAVHGMFPAWEPVLWVLAASGVPLTVAGLMVARGRTVDSELAARLK